MIEIATKTTGCATRTGACILLLAIGLANAPVQAQGAGAIINPEPGKKISIPHLEQAAHIDGKLDDGEWAQAALVDDFYQNFPVEFAKPTQHTEVRVYYTADALYVSARMTESDPSQIAARVLRQGQGLGSDDIFALILDPYLDRRNGYRFEVNPNGVRWDGLFQNISDVEGNWDGIWEAAATTDAGGWSVEMRIPFQTLSFNPNSDTWGINFLRVRRNTNESIAWLSRNREVNPSVAGIMTGLNGLKQGVGLDLVPSFSMSKRRKFGPGGADANKYEPSVDMFYKVTPQLNAALTLNTDFSATEVDDRQVNLTRFNSFFPEKRDFFLRDVYIFESGQIGSGGFNAVSGTGSAAATTPAKQNARPFFSRKLGLDSSGAPVDIIAGGKLSGRIDNWNVGALVIDQDASAVTGVEARNIFVGRTVLNVGSHTQIGAIVTDGDPQSNRDNTLVGTDFRYRNANFYGNAVETVAFYEQTQSQGVSNSDNAAFGFGMVLPNSQGWQGLYNYRQVQSNFNPAVGYVNRTGIEDHHLNFGYRQFLPPSDFFRSVLFAAEGYRAETLTDGKLLTENMGFRISSFTNTNDAAFVRYIFNKEVLALPFTIYHATDGKKNVVIPAGEYPYAEFLGSVQLGTHRKLSGNLYLQGGDYYNGTHLQERGNVTWRPNRYFSTDVSFTIDNIKLPAGDFIVRQFGFTTVVAFSSTLAWSNLLQYDNVSENLGINSRLHWIPKAGQQAFLVLNWGMVDLDKDHNFTSVVADLSLKFNYTLRF
jgi:hypothetical protein